MYRLFPFIVGAVLLIVVRRMWWRRLPGRASQHTPDSDPPLLVITPDGFIEYVRPDYPIVASAFAALASLALRVTASTTSDSSFATTHIWLDLHYRDVRVERWSPRAYFGQTEAIAQAIIAARGWYEATHS